MCTYSDSVILKCFPNAEPRSAFDLDYDGNGGQATLTIFKRRFTFADKRLYVAREGVCRAALCRDILHTILQEISSRQQQSLMTIKALYEDMATLAPLPSPTAPVVPISDTSSQNALILLSQSSQDSRFRSTIQAHPYLEARLLPISDTIVKPPSSPSTVYPATDGSLIQQENGFKPTAYQDPSSPVYDSISKNTPLGRSGGRRPTTSNPRIPMCTQPSPALTTKSFEPYDIATNRVVRRANMEPLVKDSARGAISKDSDNSLAGASFWAAPVPANTEDSSRQLQNLGWQERRWTIPTLPPPPDVVMPDGHNADYERLASLHPPASAVERIKVFCSLHFGHGRKPETYQPYIRFEHNLHPDEAVLILLGHSTFTYRLRRPSSHPHIGPDGLPDPTYMREQLAKMAIQNGCLTRFITKTKIVKACDAGFARAIVAKYSDLKNLSPNVPGRVKSISINGAMERVKQKQRRGDSEAPASGAQPVLPDTSSNGYQVPAANQHRPDNTRPTSTTSWSGIPKGPRSQSAAFEHHSREEERGRKAREVAEIKSTTSAVRSTSLSNGATSRKQHEHHRTSEQSIEPYPGRSQSSLLPRPYGIMEQQRREDNLKDQMRKRLAEKPDSRQSTAATRNERDGETVRGGAHGKHAELYTDERSLRNRANFEETSSNREKRERESPRRTSRSRKDGAKESRRRSYSPSRYRSETRQRDRSSERQRRRDSKRHERRSADAVDGDRCRARSRCRSPLRRRRSKEEISEERRRRLWRRGENGVPDEDGLSRTRGVRAEEAVKNDDMSRAAEKFTEPQLEQPCNNEAVSERNRLSKAANKPAPATESEPQTPPPLPEQVSVYSLI